MITGGDDGDKRPALEDERRGSARVCVTWECRRGWKSVEEGLWLGWERVVSAARQRREAEEISVSDSPPDTRG
ncbi:hypothetical protein PIB30_081659, partial [Stylosanthes scabra]|nr:hypothetical protein [Stylosanthes scabra]